MSPRGTTSLLWKLLLSTGVCKNRNLLSVGSRKFLGNQTADPRMHPTILQGIGACSSPIYDCFMSRSFRRPDVLRKCEQRHEASDLISFLPVADPSKDDTYANRYCAECHSVASDNIIYWQTKLQCRDTAFTPRKYETLLTDINTTSDCNLVLNPVKNDPRKSCYSLISSCNETELWGEFDSFTPQACQLILAPYMYKYRNPFCAICNGKEPYLETSCETGGPDLRPPFDLVPFSALLYFRPALEQTEQNRPEANCTTVQIYDSVKVRYVLSVFSTFRLCMDNTIFLCLYVVLA